MVSFSTVCRTGMEYYLSLTSPGIWIPKAKTKKKKEICWTFICILIQEKLEISISILLLITLMCVESRNTKFLETVQRGYRVLHIDLLSHIMLSKIQSEIHTLCSKHFSLFLQFSLLELISIVIFDVLLPKHIVRKHLLGKTTPTQWLS